MGLCILTRRSNVIVQVGLLIILLMAGWRSMIHLTSSRYASGLLFPFTFFATYSIYFLGKSKRKALHCLLLCTGIACIALWIQKNYNRSQINSNLKIVAEIHDAYNSGRDEYILVSNDEENLRIMRMEKKKNKIYQYIRQDNRTIKEIYNQLSYALDQNTLFDIVVNARNSAPFEPYNNSLTETKHVLSFFSQKNKKKRHFVYAIKSLVACPPVSSSNRISPECGILENGDLEIIDSEQDSYLKLKKHIGTFDPNKEYDASLRTPFNAYFYNAKNIPEPYPFYTCTDVGAISGKYSAYVKCGTIQQGYLIFYQKFMNGNYELSFLIKGTQGTRICILCDKYTNKKWQPVPLAFFTVPNKGLFHPIVNFSIDDLEPGDYFLVGVYIQNGEAFFDNFALHNKN